MKQALKAFLAESEETLTEWFSARLCSSLSNVGLYMPFTVTGATLFELCGWVCGKWVRKMQALNWLIIFSLLIAGSSLWLSHNGKNINPFESSPNFLSVLQGQRSSLLGKRTILLYYPHFSNYKDVVLRLYGKSFPLYILCFNCPFINWTFFNPFPQNCLT